VFPPFNTERWWAVTSLTLTLPAASVAQLPQDGKPTTMLTAGGGVHDLHGQTKVPTVAVHTSGGMSHSLACPRDVQLFPTSMIKRWTAGWILLKLRSDAGMQEEKCMAAVLSCESMPVSIDPQLKAAAMHRCTAARQLPRSCLTASAMIMLQCISGVLFL
jgi:hypothetical protein